MLSFLLIVRQLVATLLRTGKKPRLIAGQLKREQLGNSCMIRFLRLHLPNHEHRDDERQQARYEQTDVLDYRCDNRVAINT